MDCIYSNICLFINIKYEFLCFFSLKVPDSEQGRVFGGVGQIQYIGYIFGGIIISICNISVLLITVIPLILCCLALFLILIKIYTTGLHTYSD